MIAKKSIVIAYGCLAVMVLVMDRITKYAALTHWSDSYHLNPYLYFQLAINRGISWGLLHSANRVIFIAITVLIMVTTGILAYYTYSRFKDNNGIIGEVLVLAGSLSNIIDRLCHGGVIDFIVVHLGSWVWPVFNIADGAIVLGVILMFVYLSRTNTTSNELA
jgi:signal peptidase II